MDLVKRSPAVNEQASRHAWAEPNHQNQAVLWLWGRHAVSLHAGGLDPLVEDGKEDDARRGGQAQAEIDEARHGDAEAVLRLEHAVKGAEQQVHDAEDEAHVQRHEQQHGRAEQERRRTDKDLDQDLTRRGRAREPGSEGGVPARPPEARRLAVEDHLGVRLAHEGEAEELHAAADDGEHPKGPAPAFCGGDEASHHRPQDLDVSRFRQHAVSSPGACKARRLE